MNESFDHIEQYFNGKLASGEKKTFEDRCLSDPGFAKEVAFYIMMHDHARELWSTQKRQDFAMLSPQEEQGLPIQMAGEHRKTAVGSAVLPEAPSWEKAGHGRFGTVRKLDTWKYAALAAALLGAVVVGVILVVQNLEENSSTVAIKKGEQATQLSRKQDTLLEDKGKAFDTAQGQSTPAKKTPKKKSDKVFQEQLLARNFKPDETPNETEGLLDQAFEKYKKGNYKAASAAYEEALTTLEDLTTRSADDEAEMKEKERLVFYVHYYSGISYLANGNAAKAIAELKAIKQSPSVYWQSKVQWYLALSYLKAGDVTRAEALLHQVAGNRVAGKYRRQAMRLANDLQNQKQVE